jgi:hypothetical protein
MDPLKGVQGQQNFPKIEEEAHPATVDERVQEAAEEIFSHSEPVSRPRTPSGSRIPTEEAESTAPVAQRFFGIGPNIQELCARQMKLVDRREQLLKQPASDKRDKAMSAVTDEMFAIDKQLSEADLQSHKKDLKIDHDYLVSSIKTNFDLKSDNLGALKKELQNLEKSDDETTRRAAKENLAKIEKFEDDFRNTEQALQIKGTIAGIRKSIYG